MTTMAPLFARVCLFGGLFFVCSPARTAHILDGQGSEIELFPEFQCAFSHATSSNQPLGFMGRSCDYITIKRKDLHLLELHCFV